MSGYTVLRHSQHEGYYSPNNTANKATPYIFDTVVKSSDGRQIGMKFKGTGDREWVIIYVPSTDFTPTYNNVIKLINDNKDVSNRKVVIRENEKAKAARIVTNFFNSPSIAGNEKMTSYVKKPQHLKHSEDLDVIDVSDDCIEHSRRDSIPNRFYFSHISNPTVTNGKIEFNVGFIYGVKKSNGTVGGRVIYTPNVYFVYDTGNRPSKEQLAKEIKPAIVKMALNYSTPVSKEESDRAIDEAYKWVQRAPFSNTPISIKPFQTVKDEIRHSLFTEVYDMDDYLEHHGVLGMKWGVRRYQNEDGSLTKEGREHYKIEGARFKERYKGNYELALKNANDARKAAIEKAKEGKNGANFLNTAYHQQNLADRYAKKLEKKSQGLVSFEKNKETEKLGKEIYEYYKDKPMGKFVAEAIVGSTAASLASFGLSAALGLPLFMVFAAEPNRYELKDDKDKK